VKQDTIDKLIIEALAIENEEARDAGAIGYMARILVQATMPHSKCKEHVFKRRNGAFTLTMLSDPDVGLPYGSKPRLLTSWVTTEAVRTKERTLILGDSLSDFMRELGLVPTGGRWGSITSLRSQTKRLFAASVKAIYDDEKHWMLENVQVAESADLWWNPQHPNQIGIWKSTVTLSERFFKSAIDCPVPVDMRALRALSQSPLALDIYCWLTYRMSYLKHPISIPWPALEIQFGSDYKNTKHFKYKFLNQLKKVLVIYNAKVEDEGETLLLRPTQPHITRG
jgi:hypothetical protein